MSGDEIFIGLLVLGFFGTIVVLAIQSRRQPAPAPARQEPVDEAPAHESARRARPAR